MTDHANHAGDLVDQTAVPPLTAEAQTYAEHIAGVAEGVLERNDGPFRGDVVRLRILGGFLLAAGTATEGVGELLAEADHRAAASEAEAVRNYVDLSGQPNAATTFVFPSFTHPERPAFRGTHNGSVAETAAIVYSLRTEASLDAAAVTLADGLFDRAEADAADDPEAHAMTQLLELARQSSARERRREHHESALASAQEGPVHELMQRLEGLSAGLGVGRAVDAVEGLAEHLPFLRGIQGALSHAAPMAHAGVGAVAGPLGPAGIKHIDELREHLRTQDDNVAAYMGAKTDELVGGVLQTADIAHGDTPIEATLAGMLGDRLPQGTTPETIAEIARALPYRLAMRRPGLVFADQPTGAAGEVGVNLTVAAMFDLGQGKDSVLRDYVQRDGHGRVIGVSPQALEQAEAEDGRHAPSGE